MLIDSVVQKEAVRNEQMILQYESLLEALPKGSIACRKNGYYYLRYRENGKLYDKYIGKDTDTVDTIREKLALRNSFVKIENGSITDNFHFRNWRLLHRHASGVSPYLPACPCSPC